MFGLSPYRDSNADVSSVMLSSKFSICSDEELTLEMSVFESLYGGQFTLSISTLLTLKSNILFQGVVSVFEILLSSKFLQIN